MKFDCLMQEKQTKIFWPVLAFLTAFLFAAYYWRSIDLLSPFLLGDDSAQYVLLSRSILDGHGYRSIWLDGVPWHFKFPFGLPLLFAGVSSLVAGWGGFFAVIVVSAGFSLAAAFLLFQKRAGSALALGVVVLTGMTSVMSLYSRSLLSDVPFMCCLLVALWLADRFFKIGGSKPLELLGLAIFMLAAAFLRTVGALLPLVFFSLVAVRAWRHKAPVSSSEKLLAVIVLLPVASWVLLGFGAEMFSGESYWFLLTKQLDVAGGVVVDKGSGFLLSCLKGAYAIFFYAIPSAMTSNVFSARSYLAGCISGVVLLGWFFSWRKDRSIVDVFFMVYCVSLSAWPWVQSSGVRMVLPVLPLLIYYFLHAVRVMVLRFFPKSSVVGFLVVVVFLCAALSVRHGLFAQRGIIQETRVSDMHKAFDWIGKNTSKEGLFLSPLPAGVYLYAGRKAVSGQPLYGLPDENIVALFETKAFDYVFDPASVVWQRRVLLRLSHRLSLVYDDAGNRVYRVKRQDLRGDGHE